MAQASRPNANAVAIARTTFQVAQHDSWKAARTVARSATRFRSTALIASLRGRCEKVSAGHLPGQAKVGPAKVLRTSAIALPTTVMADRFVVP